jgi:hypothetical protein
MQDEWHEYLYPYKIGEYEYQLLSDPVEIATITYSASQTDSGQILGNDIKILFKQEGRCDALAIWADYDLSEDSSGPRIKHLRDYDRFVHYSKLSVKFFPRRLEVKRVSSFECDKTFDKFIHVATTYDYGNLDFKFNFDVISP